MYFGLVIIIAGSVAIYRMAEESESRGIVWGLLAFTLSMATSQLIPRPFLGPIAGLLLCYILMVGAALCRD